MKKLIIVIVIVIQVAACSVIAFQIFKNNSSVLGVTIDPIRREDIISSKSGVLKEFYELAPDNKITDDLSIFGEEYKYKVTYQINSDGIHANKNYLIPKPDNTFRILTIGASFTFGANVNTNENYPSQFQQLLDNNCTDSKFEVINLGVGGYDLSYSVERLRIRGMKYEPDLVVWYFTNDDFLRFNEKLSETNKKINIKDIDDILIRQKYNIGKIREFYNNKLVLYSSKNLQPEFKNTLKRIATINNNVTYYPGIPDIYENKAFFPDKHPNFKGYNLIAKSIFDNLISSKLIPCN